MNASIPATAPRRLPNSPRIGVALAAGTALISGLAIYLNASAVKVLPDPAVYTTLKNGIAALILVGVATAVVDRRSIRSVDRSGWAGLVLVGSIGGGIPFILFFTGLAQASAPSAAFIHKTLFLWVALLAVPLLGERLGLVQVVALAALLVAQAVILPPTGMAWGTGETMIAAATAFWAVETVVARRLLRSMPSPILAAGRLGVGLVVLLAYLAATGRIGALLALDAAALAWATVTGILLAGYVGTWMAALQRAPATVVASVLVLGAVVTGGLQAATRGALPDPAVIGGYVLIVAASGLVAAAAIRVRPRAVAEAAA